VHPEDFYKLQTGITLEDGFMKVDKIVYHNNDQHNQVVVTIHSGRKRIVRRLFQYLGYKVTHLDRINFGGLTKKDLPLGTWRTLTYQEIMLLIGGKDNDCII
jgi:23S rRNA pseudouridine2605 synthase